MLGLWQQNLAAAAAVASALSTVPPWQVPTCFPYPHARYSRVSEGYDVLHATQSPNVTQIVRRYCYYCCAQGGKGGIQG